jgi:hypothetical protein
MKLINLKTEQSQKSIQFLTLFFYLQNFDEAWHEEFVSLT